MGQDKTQTGRTRIKPTNGAGQESGGGDKNNTGAGQ